MAATILKNTPIHVVVLVTGDAEETIKLDELELTALGQGAGDAPIVDIVAVHWSIPAEATATIARDSETILSLSYTGSLPMDGYSLSIDNEEDIEVHPQGGFVIVELKKMGGYEDSQHTTRG